MCCAGPGFWDARATAPFDALYWDVHWLQHIPDGNMLSTEYPNGLLVERLVPGRTFRFFYKRADCAFDLTWDAVADPHEVVPDHQVTDDAFSGHFEQPGRMTGRLALGADEYAVDCWSMRDRSWGPRDTHTAHQGDYLWGIAGENESFHAISVLDGETNRIHAGYLRRDGETADLTSGRTWTEGRIGGLRSDRIVVEAQDALGRTLHAEGRTRNGVLYQVYPRATIVWGLVGGGGDGPRGVGRAQEVLPAETVRDMLRGAG